MLRSLKNKQAFSSYVLRDEELREARHLRLPWAFDLFLSRTTVALVPPCCDDVPEVDPRALETGLGVYDFICRNCKRPTGLSDRFPVSAEAAEEQAWLELVLNSCSELDPLESILVAAVLSDELARLRKHHWPEGGPDPYAARKRKPLW